MFTRLTRESELPPKNEAKEFPCGDKMICIANVNGTITAMDNVCLHRGGPLGQGVIEKGKLLCPWSIKPWKDLVQPLISQVHRNRLSQHAPEVGGHGEVSSLVEF